MKKMIIAVFLVALLLLLAAAPAAAEQMVAKSFDSWRCGGPGDNDARKEECMKFCRRSTTDINALLNSGFRVISVKDYQVMTRPFKTNRVSFSDDGFCECKGTDYVLGR